MDDKDVLGAQPLHEICCGFHDFICTMHWEFPTWNICTQAEMVFTLFLHMGPCIQTDIGVFQPGYSFPATYIEVALIAPAMILNPGPY